MTTKQKNDMKRKRPSLWLGFLIALGWIPFCIIVVLGIGFSLTYHSSYLTENTLPEKLLPTAESLLIDSVQSEYIELPYDITLRFDIFGNATTNAGRFWDLICVSGYIPTSASYSSTMVVNGEAIRTSANWYNAILEPPRDGYDHIYHCAEADLQRGLYLIEFYLKHPQNRQLNVERKWAVEID